MPERPALVLVPGLGLDERAWQPTVDALHLQGYDDVSVLPLPGYGLPATGSTDLSPRALARTVAAHLLARPTVQVLLGHSASCQVVAQAAALAPDRVLGLALVGPTTDPRGRTWTRLALRWLATARREDPRQIPGLLGQYRRTGLLTMARAMDAARRELISESVARLGCPVLTVRGRHDRICPEDWAVRLSRGRVLQHRSPASVTLPAGAHMVPLTHGALVAEVVAGARWS